MDEAYTDKKSRWKGKLRSASEASRAKTRHAGTEGASVGAVAGVGAASTAMPALATGQRGGDAHVDDVGRELYPRAGALNVTTEHKVQKRAHLRLASDLSLLDSLKPLCSVVGQIRLQDRLWNIGTMLAARTSPVSRELRNPVKIDASRRDTRGGGGSNGVRTREEE
ncbi:hypothetical protein KM043_015419 [Ampulex compressa]|nr:hypothetical protein KM043_015419 [Ampulex compressa]